MKPMLQIPAVALILLFVKLACPAYGQQIIFNKVPPPDGKTFVHVTGICQDLNGYMWFATKKGLCRYDGYQIITYKNNPLDPNSLASDLLETICVDSTGIVWIGTQGAGLDRFDPSTGIFKHFRHDINKPLSINSDYVSVVMTDREGILWVGGNGLDRYDKQTDAFIHYLNKPGDSTSISSNEVVAIYEDRQSTLWIGTGSIYGEYKGVAESGGLNRMNKATGTFTRFKHDAKNPNSLINNKVRAIFEDSKGTFWVGTAGDGLHTMDREKGTFVRYSYDPMHPEKLSRPPLNNDFTETDHITFIREDAAGTIWIGTSESGINNYDPKTGGITHYESGKDIDGAFTDRTSWWSYTSREGVLWISTLFGNLYRIDPLRKEIPHYTSPGGAVHCFYEDKKGVLWLATNQGIIRKDSNNEIIRLNNVGKPLSAVSNTWTSVIKEDDQGEVWIGGGGGLTRWNTKTGKLITYKNDPKNKQSLSNNGVITLQQDIEGNLWIGTYMGLNFLNRKTGSFNHYLLNPTDTSSFGQNFIAAILTDKTGKVWVGSSAGAGINLLNRETGEFKNYLKVFGISCLFEDGEGVIWAGSNDGLYKYDLSSDTYIRYKDSNTLSEISSVLSIVEDNQRNIWLATTTGIVKINPQRNETYIYGKKYETGESGFSYGSSYKGRHGEIYFGDDTGYISFYPNELTKNIKPPEIIITAFSLADQIVKPGNNGPLKQRLSQVKNIALRYDQNVFSFDFSAIDYTDPQANRHLFMLENYDKIWHQANSERRAYYFNIPPGKYVFRVKASNSLGVWAEKKIDIIILPPWWLTWWAYCIYGLFFIAALFGIDRFQRRRLLQAEKERNREREIAQAKEIEKAYTELKATQAQLIQSEKMASLGELTAGIAHEIQNPLNFVNNFSEVSNELLDEMKDELAAGNWQLAAEIANDVQQNLEKITHHGKRADAIVKGMLQHSRISNGVKEPTDINALCDEFLRLSYHGLRAKDKSFNATLKTDFDQSIGKIDVIPQDIGRVILNLLTNAFYAVAEKRKQIAKDLSVFENLTGLNKYEPTVSLSTKKMGEKVLISVKDNGNGIPKKVLDKIFQPFFTTKPAGEGTGLGLSLSYEIITKVHGGELSVNTKEGEFAEFVVIL